MHVYCNICTFSLQHQVVDWFLKAKNATQYGTYGTGIEDYFGVTGVSKNTVRYWTVLKNIWWNISVKLRTEQSYVVQGRLAILLGLANKQNNMWWISRMKYIGKIEVVAIWWQFVVWVLENNGNMRHIGSVSMVAPALLAEHGIWWRVRMKPGYFNEVVSSWFEL